MWCYHPYYVIFQTIGADLQLIMSLLSEIQGFSKSKLKPTDTVVQAVDGRTLSETKDKYGHITAKVTSTGAMGFVGDYKPDLQVAFVMPGLSFGE